jgi:hypothetical protein
MLGKFLTMAMKRPITLESTGVTKKPKKGKAANTTEILGLQEALPIILDDDSTIEERNQSTDWVAISDTKKVRTIISPLTGNLLLELRKFEDDEKTPTETGIYLDESQIARLKSLLPSLETAYESILTTNETFKFTKNLGNNVFVGLNSSFLCVDLRKFFTTNGLTENIPSKKNGIALNLVQVKQLHKFLNDINPSAKTATNATDTSNN